MSDLEEITPRAIDREAFGLPPRPQAFAEEARRHWVPLREDCVCGGSIVAVTFLPEDIVYAVRQHQIEPVHIAYDVDHGIALAPWQMQAGVGR